MENQRKLTFKSVRNLIYRGFCAGFPFDELLEFEIFIKKDLEKYESHVSFILDAIFVIKQWAEKIADFLSFDYVNLNYSNIEEYIDNQQSDALPLSDKESFDCLIWLNDVDLRNAIGDLTNNQQIRFELLNAIKDENYAEYKELINYYKLSSYHLNIKLKNLKLFEINYKVLNNFFTIVDTDIITDEKDAFVYENSLISNIDFNLSSLYIDMMCDASDSKFYDFIKISLIRLLSLMKYCVDCVENNESSHNPFTKDISQLKYSDAYNIIIKWGIKSYEEDLLKMSVMENNLSDYDQYNLSMNNLIEDSYNHIESTMIKEIRDIRHFEFPSRFINEVEPTGIAHDDKDAILKDIYDVLSGSFDGMSKEDFVYLFGGSNKVPDTYKVPYYWSGDESTMKAILRIFYNRQPPLAKSIILHSSDRKTGAAKHNWGKNKDSVSLKDLEKSIIEIIKNRTGKTLKSLPKKDRKKGKPKM